MSTDASPDVGLRAIGLIHERLLIDEEWTGRWDRGWSWMGYRLEQAVMAFPPEPAADLTLSLIMVYTTVVDDVDMAPERVQRALATLNARAVGSAYVFRAEDRCVQLVLAHQVHEETLADRSEELAAYVILQLCQAEEEADDLAAALGGSVAGRTHPTSGDRIVPDEMLTAVEAVYAPAGREPSQFANAAEMATVVDLTRQGTACASVGSDAGGVCVEVPFGEDMTTLIEIRSDVVHPWLGTGLAVRTTLPPAFSEEQLGPAVAHLQDGQLGTTVGGSQIGAWSIGRHRPEPYLTWTRFVPNRLYQPNRIFDVAMGEINRAAWIDRLFHPDLPPRSAWPIMLHRLQAARMPATPTEVS